MSVDLPSSQVYPRHIRLALLCLGLCTALMGCTNRGTYEGVQTSNRLDCERLPRSQRQECVDRNSLSYEEYQRERDALDSGDGSREEPR